jgi:hypothetical protein
VPDRAAHPSLYRHQPSFKIQWTKIFMTNE